MDCSKEPLKSLGPRDFSKRAQTPTSPQPSRTITAATANVFNRQIADLTQATKLTYYCTFMRAPELFELAS